MSQEALETIRRCSTIGGARRAIQGHPVDLYHRGEGHRFSIKNTDLAALVRRGLQVTRAEQAATVDAGEDDSALQALVQCGAALLEWLE